MMLRFKIIIFEFIAKLLIETFVRIRSSIVYYYVTLSVYIYSRPAIEIVIFSGLQASVMYLKSLHPPLYW